MEGLSTITRKSAAPEALYYHCVTHVEGDWAVVVQGSKVGGKALDIDNHHSSRKNRFPPVLMH